MDGATFRGLLESISQRTAPFPDQDVCLHRPIRAFSRWLPHTDSGSTIIGMDVVAQVVLDFEIESSIRKTLGVSAKNFENARRGKHSISSTTLTRIQHDLGLLEMVVPTTLLSEPQGPLAPEANFGLKVLEGLLSDATRVSKMEHSRSCPCCGHECYVTAITWATRAHLGLDEPTARLVDRLLNLLVLMRKVLTTFSGDPGQLCEPLRFNHPLRYWMQRLKASYEADTWEHLAVLIQQQTPVRALRDTGVSAGRLRKWASTEIPPRNIVYAITQGQKDQLSLRAAYHVARLYALILELISAASEFEEIDRRSLCEAVAARYDHLVESEESVTSSGTKTGKI